MRPLTINAWAGLVFLATAIIASLSVFAAIRAQEEVSIRMIAETQSRRMAEQVFEHLYSVMRRGWTRDEIEEILTRINAADAAVSVEVIRSAQVSQQYGEIRRHGAIRIHDPAIRDALQTGTEAFLRTETEIRFVFPVLNQPECAVCHETPIGSVNGVIDVRMPIDEIRSPLAFSLNTAIAAFITVLAVVFLVFFAKIKLLLIRPIHLLAQGMSHIMERGDVSHRLARGRFWPREVSSLVGSFNALMGEIEENRRLLSEQAVKDHLTGLFNKRKFEEEILTVQARAERYGGAYSLAIIDLDGFKPINDTFGHAAGDSVLIQVANLLRANLRHVDVVARIGGDEFAIILPETDGHQAQAIAAKIAAEIDQADFHFDGSVVKVGASIGLASYPADAQDPGSLFTHADAAMYQAKKARKEKARDRKPQPAA